MRLKVLKLGSLLLIGLPVTLYLLFYLFLSFGEWRAGQDRALAESIFKNSKEAHEIYLLDHGKLSLAERIRLIRSAEKSIELEFFIYNLDGAARLITHELLKKAQEGVRVRLLVDFSVPVFVFGPEYAFYLKERGVEVRYYNTSGLERIFAVQHRSHRKLLIVDGKKMITGGRNIADEYFDLHQSYNFLDSDIFVSGEIVGAALSSFELYWNSEYASSPEASSTDLDPEEFAHLKEFFVQDVDLGEKANSILRSAPSSLVQPHICRDTTFVTDFPGALQENRRVFYVLSELFASAEEEVIGESPYVVLRREGLDLIQSMVSKGIRTRLLSNSLYSTDAFYTVAALWPTLDDLSKTGIELMVYGGRAPEYHEVGRYGIHSKRAVVDNKTVIVGTYNVDPRSANLNSELLVVCKDQPELAREAKQSVLDRMTHSKSVVNRDLVEKEVLLENAPLKDRVLFWLSMPLASGFAFLL